ncbi:MAG: sialate O-acetylesterase [Alphaproteobacteria bacterium]|nr:sialate O-acetylesterase [Alphaproteobacteria bacterium]MDE2164325.1 sialate O-acetylesterase [Alphaproteobacteria bacterium]
MNKSPWMIAPISLCLLLGGCAGSVGASSSFTSDNTSKSEKTETATKSPPLLHAIFQDHEVLQRNKPIPVWGTANPGDKVTVSLAGESANATADADGNWEAALAPLKAGGPYELTATSSSGQTQTNQDVLIGDVYLCSGQSNMEFPLRLASNYDADLNSASNPNIRLLHVERFPSATPLTTFGAGAEWSVTSPQTAKEFSAVCYFFGRDLQPVVNVPVGLIESSWGGSVIQAWISREKMHALGDYDQALDLLSLYAKSPQEAIKQWNNFARDWWHTHDPASSATPPWSAPDYDDSAWATITPPGTWREWNVPALETFNGIVWLREHVTLTAAQAKSAAKLSLGPIDQADIAWVNGTEVGALEGYDVNRNYDVPAGTLHAGDNLIALGVQGGAGILWPADKMTLALGDGTVVPLANAWRYKLSATMDQTGVIPDVPWLNQFGLTDLYNGMIEPLSHVPVSGILWYQGESDAGHPEEYARLLPAMIGNWRQKFGANTPFMIVQLPNFGPYSTKPEHSDWAEMREVERHVADTTPNTGLAVTIDVGQTDFLHPTDKQDVGARLALLAEHMVYDMPVEDSGPTPVAAIRHGRTVTVSFAHVDKGMLTYETNRPISFQVCDKADTCRFVDAAQKNNDVVLDISHIRHPAKVRFCWADSPICNVYNGDDLPAVPFQLPITKAAYRRK